MTELTVLRRPAVAEVADEEKEHTWGGCCEPECGPETCGTEATAEELRKGERDRASGGCCEPECGPETC